MASERAADLQISDWSNGEAGAFMNTEWPAYDAPLGLKWESHDVALVGRVQGKAVGAARGMVAGGVGTLGQLLVKKDVARTGIGSRLLLEFEARCKALRCHKIRLETGDYQARPFYERHGFSVVATLTNDRFGRTFFVMEKRL